MTSDPCRFSDELLGYLRRRNHAEAKNYLIRVDRPSRLVDARGATLLHCAAECENAHMMRYFLDRGFAIDQRDHEGQTPLMYALRTRNAATVELLVSRGADIYARARNDRDRSPLQEALISPVDAILKTFLHQLRREHPTNEALAAILHENLYTLHPVVHLRNAEVTRLLLDRGHCPAATYHEGITSLGMAIRLLDVDHVRLLLERGMNVNGFAASGLLPVHSIPQRNWPRKLEIVRLLVDSGADFNRLCRGDKLTEAPYHVMFEFGTREMVRALLQADREFAADNIRTLLIRAAQNGNAGVLEEIARGLECDVSSCRDERGRGVLSYAVEHGHASAIEVLLSEGADVDFAAEFDGKTALAKIILCELSPNSKMERLKILLEHGADPQRAFVRYYADRSTPTPLEEVVARNELHLAKPLLAYVALRERISRQPVLPKTRSLIEADQRLGRYFRLCEKHVRIMEKTRIRSPVTLLDLLTKDVGWIASRVRDANFESQMTLLCNKLSLNKYYSSKLQRRAREIVEVVNVRRKVAGIFDDIFGLLYGKNYLITDKIVSFMNCRDLHKALGASTKSG